ncbi:MAG: cupin domain-containing protein [Rhodospirillaceae bacterium]|nr:cupin domain-containing protein [Rhodospirillales bacterium]
MSADAIIARLGLAPHPEGGHYAETYRHSAEGGARGACTAIYYLLKAGERSHWHRVDAVEVWNFHAGAPLRLKIAEGGQVRELVLGADVLAGQVPQAVVPAHAWQAAEAMDGWSLVGCIVAPAFAFAGFEMAPPGWQPEEIEASGN